MTITLAVIGILAFPVIAYLTTKLVVFAFYRAKHQAERMNRENHNGKA